MNLKKIFLTIIAIFFYGWRLKKYNLVIFNSYKNKRFDFNSKYLFLYMIKNTKYNCKFIINDNHLRKKLTTEIGNYFISDDNLKDLKKIFTAGVWITSTGFPIITPFFQKDRIIINLWHGVPLKKVGLSIQTSKVKKILAKWLCYKNYTFISTTSKNIIDVMSKNFEVPESKIRVLGQPRNDLLNKKQKRDEIKKIFPNLPIFKKIILYAPTYRDGKKTKIFPFPNFKIENLEKFLDENEYIIFLRTHKLEKGLKNLKNSKRIQVLNEDKVDDILEILNIFDLLITDYSSIYIDFLILNRPIIFLDYDRKIYLETRGLNFDYDVVTPGPKPKDIKEFQDEIFKLLNSTSYFKNERKKMNMFFNDITQKSSYSTLLEIEKEIRTIKKNKVKISFVKKGEGNEKNTNIWNL